MATSNNLFFQHFSGAIGKQIVFRQFMGKTVVSKYPDMNKRVLSPKQLRTTEIMEEASYYAKGIIADPEQKNVAQLRLNVTSNRLYPALVREYFKQARENDANENANENANGRE